MKLADLQLFLLAAELGNLSKVAEHLELSQSAVTKTIHRLEKELHVTLLERTSRGVTLTAIGQVFADRIQPVNADLQMVLTEVEAMREGGVGNLRIGALPATIDIVLAPVLKVFQDWRPRVTVSLNAQPTAILLDDLLLGKLDFVIGGLPRICPANLNHERLCDLSNHVVASVDHPLCRPRAKARDLAAARWLLPPRGWTVRQWVEQEVKAMGLPMPMVTVETKASALAITSIIRMSNLLTVMNGQNLRSPAGHGLSALDHLVVPDQRTIALFWRREGNISPLMADFMDTIRRHLPGRS